MGSLGKLTLFNQWCTVGLTLSCQNPFPNIPEKTSHSSQGHLSYRGMNRAMDFRNCCLGVAFSVSKRGRVLFLPSISMDICRSIPLL